MLMSGSDHFLNIVHIYINICCVLITHENLLLSYFSTGPENMLLTWMHNLLLRNGLYWRTLLCIWQWLLKKIYGLIFFWVAWRLDMMIGLVYVYISCWELLVRVACMITYGSFPSLGERKYSNRLDMSNIIKFQSPLSHTLVYLITQISLWWWRSLFSIIQFPINIVNIFWRNYQYWTITLIYNVEKMQF